MSSTRTRTVEIVTITGEPFNPSAEIGAAEKESLFSICKDVRSALDDAVGTLDVFPKKKPNFIKAYDIPASLSTEDLNTKLAKLGFKVREKIEAVAA